MKTAVSFIFFSCNLFVIAFLLLLQLICLPSNLIQSFVFYVNRFFCLSRPRPRPPVPHPQSLLIFIYHQCSSSHSLTCSLPLCLFYLFFSSAVEAAKAEQEACEFDAQLAYR